MADVEDRLEMNPDVVELDEASQSSPASQAISEEPEIDIVDRLDEPDKVEEPSQPDKAIPASSLDIEKLLEEKLASLQDKTRQDTLEKGLKELVETLKPKEPPSEPSKPVSARLTAEEKKRINEELYSTDNPAELIDSILASKMESLIGLVAGETSKKLVEHERELLKVSSPEFKEFEKDIEEIVSSLPPQQRYTPGVYKWALEQAKTKNIDKLVEMRLAEKLKELEKKQASKPIPPKQTPSQASTVASPQKPRVAIPKWEIELATAKGVGPGSSFWDQTKEMLIQKYSKQRRS